MKKFLKAAVKILIVVVLIAALLCGVGAVYYAASRSCDVSIKTDETKASDFYGWGTSNCWWSDDISDSKTRTEIAKQLFSKDGLGLNIYRYNIGGGYNPDNNAVSNKWRLNESFYVEDEQTGEWKYDFTRDANAQAMLDEALKYGCVDTVILFANSPHYTMCKNGRSSGNDDEWTCNIDSSQYQAYADYFLTITQYFIDKGVPVKYISPINEPQWGWGGSEPRQEGCHYEKDEAVALFKVFAKAIKEKGMTVKLCSPESGNIGDTTKDYYDKMINDPDIREQLGTFSYHSYFSDSDYMKKLRFGSWRSKNTSENLRFDMSEWCELPAVYDITNVKSALVMARVISQDTDATGVSSWSNWVAMNENGISDEDSKNYSDGLLVADPDNTADYQTAYRYYAYKQYSAFIPTGSKRIDCGESVFTFTAKIDKNDGLLISKSINSSAYLTPDGKLVIVVVNEGKDRNIKLPADGYSKMSVYTTDKTHKCENTYSGELQQELINRANSINTYVLEK